MSTFAPYASLGSFSNHGHQHHHGHQPQPPPPPPQQQYRQVPRDVVTRSQRQAVRASMPASSVATATAAASSDVEHLYDEIHRDIPRRHSTTTPAGGGQAGSDLMLHSTGSSINNQKPKSTSFSSGHSQTRPAPPPPPPPPPPQPRSRQHVSQWDQQQQLLQDGVHLRSTSGSCGGHQPRSRSEHHPRCPNSHNNSSGGSGSGSFNHYETPAPLLKHRDLSLDRITDALCASHTRHWQVPAATEAAAASAADPGPSSLPTTVTQATTTSSAAATALPRRVSASDEYAIVLHPPSAEAAMQAIRSVIKPLQQVRHPVCVRQPAMAVLCP